MQRLRCRDRDKLCRMPTRRIRWKVRYWVRLTPRRDFAMTAPKPHATLMQRLGAGPVICAEGYVFELERLGYLQAGAFVPQVVLAHHQALTHLRPGFVDVD